MKILSPKIHGAIDYLSVVALVAAPTLFGHGGNAAMLAYSLAAIHLILTVMTAFPLGLVKVVPFKAHGMVELLVGAVLVVVPWVLTGAFYLTNNGRMFFTAFGAALLAVRLTTDYKD